MSIYEDLNSDNESIKDIIIIELSDKSKSKYIGKVVSCKKTTNATEVVISIPNDILKPQS